ncbi:MULTISPECIES: hypothetical protein [Haloferax]|uniref:hypothetical protein n=1 Tax=Haloferax TaxID=2251 RepID=UPI001CDA2177|nr:MULTISPECIES: hypothetical protein [Haloferax]
MSVVPGTIDTARQPPMTVPLRHFVVALGLLLVGIGIELGVAVGVVLGTGYLAHVHLVLVGWVCLTIMGAMTQFVPVWSGVELHSRRLSTVQLWLVAGGLLGFAGSLLTSRLGWLPVFGGAMLLGFWLFVYNVGRTLGATSEYDVTERHFLLALGFFVLVSSVGVLLAVDGVHPVFASLSLTRSAVITTHVTLALFGAVMTTILGALYQLGTMFTQTKLHGVDIWLRRAEEVGYPVGVVLLAVGRLFDALLVARVGGVLVTVTLFGFSIVLARRLTETSVEWNPMLTRYAVVVPALALWSGLTFFAWLGDPLAYATRFGAPSSFYLLVLGVVGFVVFGTLYHVVPFVVWVHRYSDLLGYEPVPMIDDLYSDRIATFDFGLVVTGTFTLVATKMFSLPSLGGFLGRVLLLTGVVFFVVNILRVVHVHSPHSLVGVLFTAQRRDENDGAESTGSRSVERLR